MLRPLWRPATLPAARALAFLHHHCPRVLNAALGPSVAALQQRPPASLVRHRTKRGVVLINALLPVSTRRAHHGPLQPSAVRDTTHPSTLYLQRTVSRPLPHSGFFHAEPSCRWFHFPAGLTHTFPQDWCRAPAPPSPPSRYTFHYTRYPPTFTPAARAPRPHPPPGCCACHLLPPAPHPAYPHQARRHGTKLLFERMGWRSALALRAAHWHHALPAPHSLLGILSLQDLMREHAARFWQQ